MKLSKLFSGRHGKKWTVAAALAVGLGMALFTAIPRAITTAATQRDLPIYCVQKDSKVCALTFDAAWGNEDTQQLIDILGKYKVKATFFVVGVNAETYPELIRRELSEGHEIGNHSYNHYHIAKMSAEAFEKDLAACSAVIEKITGARTHLFRPPEGVCTGVTKSICGQKAYTIVMWSVDTRDWAHTPVEEICRNVQKNAKDGSIILMHDFIGKNSPTPAALRRIIPMLQESGFEFVTISQLLEG